MNNAHALEATGIDARAREDALVERTRADPAAFGELYELFLTPVYRYLRTRTESHEEAADLTHLVFLKVFEAMPRYRIGRTPFSAWLFRIARNAATDAARHRRQGIPWDLVAPLMESHDPDPEAASLRRERIHELRFLLAWVSAEKRELLALRFAAGLSSREIAAVVGKSEAAVKRQLSRTLAELREQTRGK